MKHGGFFISRTYSLFFGGGSFFKLYFRRRQPDRQPLALEWKSTTNLEVQGPFGDEGTFQKIQKWWTFTIWQFSATRSGGTGSQKVAGGVSAHFRLAKTQSIAIWGKICFWGVGWGGVGMGCMSMKYWPAPCHRGWSWNFAWNSYFLGSSRLADAGANTTPCSRPMGLTRDDKFTTSSVSIAWVSNGRRPSKLLKLSALVCKVWSKCCTFDFQPIVRSCISYGRRLLLWLLEWPMMGTYFRN